MRPMKKSAAALLALFALLSGAASAAQYEVDQVHSLVLYRIMHLGVTPSYGVFTGISGDFTFDPAAPEAAAVEISVDTLSINSFNQGRDNHLKGADFFNVDEHFAMTFKSTAWKATGENAYEVAGDLSFMGVTKPVTVAAVYGGKAKGPRGDDRCGFEVTFTIKRSDYGMTKYLPDALGDEVRVVVALEGIQKPAE